MKYYNIFEGGEMLESEVTSLKEVKAIIDKDIAELYSDNHNCPLTYRDYRVECVEIMNAAEFFEEVYIV